MSLPHDELTLLYADIIARLQAEYRRIHSSWNRYDTGFLASLNISPSTKTDESVTPEKFQQNRRD